MGECALHPPAALWNVQKRWAPGGLSRPQSQEGDVTVSLLFCLQTEWPEERVDVGGVWRHPLVVHLLSVCPEAAASPRISSCTEAVVGSGSKTALRLLGGWHCPPQSHPSSRRSLHRAGAQ